MTASTHPCGYVHSALFYRSEQEYLDVVVPFVVGGLAVGEPVLAAVPAPNLALLRDALGDAAAEVTMADSTEVARNPSRAIAVEDGFVGEHPDSQVRMVGEIVWPGRSEVEYPACVQHEALVNAVFEGREVTGLCPYDAGRLDEGVLADARTTHPLLWHAGSADRCPDYAPGDALARYNQPLPNGTAAVTRTVRALADLGPARSLAARYAAWLGLSPDRTADLLLITTELATNSLQHTDDGCRLAFWEHDGHIVCEASDRGRLDDPLAGRRAPAAEAATGRGLFLVNAMADLVRTHATASGTTIQAYLRLDAPRWEPA